MLEMSKSYYISELSVKAVVGFSKKRYVLMSLSLMQRLQTRSGADDNETCFFYMQFCRQMTYV